MDSAIIRPLTEADILEMFGRTLPKTCRGWAVEYEGKLAAIAGVVMEPSLMLAFSEIKPDLAASRFTIWRIATKLWNNIKGLGFRDLYAIASPYTPGAPAFLERLGFTPYEKSARGEIFKWVIQ